MISDLVRYRPTGVGSDGGEGLSDLTDYDVLPPALNRALDGASHIEIDDPLSFPFEDAGPSFWETPLLVRLPDMTFDACVDLFDRLLFRRLTVCDQVAAPKPLVAPLSRRYGFPRSMFVPLDHRPDPDVLDVAARVTAELRRRHSTLYTEWPLPSMPYKRRLLQVDRAVRQAVDETPVIGGSKPAVELHGWHVRRLIPAAWGDLIRVVERRPIALERLALDYQPSSLDIVGPGSPVQPLGTDVGIGVDHLRQSSDRAIERGLSLLFGSVQVGGRLVLVETFDGARSPDEFVDLLLEVSTHRLILQDLHILGCDDDQASTTAVFVLTKIGKWVRT